MSERTRRLIGAEEIERIIARLAHEILEPEDARKGIELFGIRRGGEALAQRLAAHIERIDGVAPTLGYLNVNLYRDDNVVHALPESQIPDAVDGRSIVIVDDVLFTGRTVRSALDALIDLGRPSAIRLCVLVDRGLRELPVQGDYVGRRIPTSRRERVVVTLAPTPAPTDEVLLLDPDA